jgi:hypothetical protein
MMLLKAKKSEVDFLNSDRTRNEMDLLTFFLVAIIFSWGHLHVFQVLSFYQALIFSQWAKFSVQE